RGVTIPVGGSLASHISNAQSLGLRVVALLSSLAFAVALVSTACSEAAASAAGWRWTGDSLSWAQRHVAAAGGASLGFAAMAASLDSIGAAVSASLVAALIGPLLALAFQGPIAVSLITASGTTERAGYFTIATV